MRGDILQRRPAAFIDEDEGIGKTGMPLFGLVLSIPLHQPTPSWAHPVWFLAPDRNQRNGVHYPLQAAEINPPRVRSNRVQVLFRVGDSQLARHQAGQKGVAKVGKGLSPCLVLVGRSMQQHCALFVLLHELFRGADGL